MKAISKRSSPPRTRHRGARPGDRQAVPDRRFAPAGAVQQCQDVRRRRPALRRDGQDVLSTAARSSGRADALPRSSGRSAGDRRQGKTLVPGLWDSHMHMSRRFQTRERGRARRHLVPQSGRADRAAQSQRERRTEGTLLAPEGFTSVIVDGRARSRRRAALPCRSLEETWPRFARSRTPTSPRSNSIRR